MSQKLFLVFTQMGRFPPKLYKRQSFVNKALQKEKSYTIKQFENQISASNALSIYKMEHKKYKINAKKLQLENKIKELNPNNVSKEITQKQHDKQEGKKQKLTSKITAQNLSTDKSNKILNKIEQKEKKIAELQLIKQSLYCLTPSMQKMLAYYTPTASLIPINPMKVYTGFFDGCSKFNPGPSGAGYYIMDRDQTILQACWPLGTKTNNQAEFMALFYLLVDAYVNKIKNINIYGDSKLAIESSSGRMRVSHPNIVEYSEAVNKMLRLFSYKKLEFIQRKYNSMADKLSNEALKKKFETVKPVEKLSTEQIF